MYASFNRLRIYRDSAGCVYCERSRRDELRHPTDRSTRAALSRRCARCVRCLLGFTDSTPPPCTHLSVSGARHFAEKRQDGRQAQGIAFFMQMIKAPVPMIAVENPVCIMSKLYRKPDQIIQPWMFGHGETKATCLWLKGLPLLRPTSIVEGRTDRIHKMAPSPDRGKLRSATYQGIADAMADQWGAINTTARLFG